MKKISERISYLPSSLQPLSSDVGFVHGDRYEWIFDVGCSIAAREIICGINRDKNAVLSHFHPDHTGNLTYINFNAVYCGGYTRKKFSVGTEIKEPVTFCDGVNLTVFPIPCAHAKGSAGLEVNEEYAFIGDAVYGAVKNGRNVFNVSLLKETILVLSSLKAEKFLISHDPDFVKSKTEVLDDLNALYNMRKTGEAYLYL